MEAGTIGEERFIRIIEEVTGGIILSDEQYAECVNKLKGISQVVIKETPEKSVETICDVVSRYLDKLVIHETTFESILSLFADQKHRVFLSLWGLGSLVLWREKITQIAEMDLRDTILTILPESIVNLTNLTNLELDWHKITHLPKRIGGLKNITELYL